MIMLTFGGIVDSIELRLRRPPFRFLHQHHLGSDGAVELADIFRFSDESVVINQR